jgi:hypothetical protein
VLWAVATGGNGIEARHRLDAGTSLLEFCIVRRHLLPAELLAKCDDRWAAGLYASFAEPLTKLADAEAKKTLQPAGLPRFYGAVAAFLWNHRHGGQFRFENQQSVYRKLEELYDSALRLDSSNWRYLLGRGEARMGRLPEVRRSQDGLRALLEKVEKDASDAKKASSDSAALADALLGHRGLEIGRLKPLTAALADFEKAAADLEKACPKLPPRQRPEYLLYASMANLEVWNATYALYRDQRSVLDKSIKWLEKARDFAVEAALITEQTKQPYIEDAYEALGNAHEDLAWQARVEIPTNYHAAILNFEKANKQRASAAFARDLGRCWLKILQDSQRDRILSRLGRTAAKAEEECLTALENAIKLAPQSADAHRWLAEAYATLKRYDEADKAYAAALELGKSQQPGDRPKWIQLRLAAAFEDAQRFIDSVSRPGGAIGLDDFTKRMESCTNELRSEQRFLDAARLSAKVDLANQQSLQAYRKLIEVAIAPTSGPNGPTLAPDQRELLDERIALRKAIYVDGPATPGADVIAAAEADAKLSNRAEDYNNWAKVANKSSDAKVRYREVFRANMGAIALKHSDHVNMRNECAAHVSHLAAVLHKDTSASRQDLETTIGFIDQILREPGVEAYRANLEAWKAELRKRVR